MNPKVRRQRNLTDQIKLELLGFVEAPPGYVGNRRCHTYWELMYVGSGTGRVRYRDRFIEFTSTDLLLIAPNEEHQVFLTGHDGLDLLYIGFSLGFDPGLRPISQIPCNLYPENRSHVAKEILANTLKQLKREAVTSAAAACSILYVLAIIAWSITDDVSTGNERTEVVEKAKSYLERNTHRQISVKEMAEHVHLSGHYCSTLFKETVGMSPKQYHSSLRMTLAAETLKNDRNDKSISEIADILGFSSVHYFSRKFKEHFGTSPTRFRESGAPDKGLLIFP